MISARECENADGIGDEADNDGGPADSEKGNSQDHKVHEDQRRAVKQAHIFIARQKCLCNDSWTKKSHK